MHRMFLSAMLLCGKYHQNTTVQSLQQIILEHKHDYKNIFSIANGLLFRKQESLLQPISPVSKLAEGFSKLFQTKIDNIVEKCHEKNPRTG